MVNRRRNNLVLWEWSPSGKHRKPRQDGGRKRSVPREALGAALLLGVLIFIIAKIPTTTDDYRRAPIATYMCDSVGVDPGTLECAAVSIGGWFAVVVTVGIVLKVGRIALKTLGAGKGKR